MTITEANDLCNRVSEYDDGLFKKEDFITLLTK